MKKMYIVMKMSSEYEETKNVEIAAYENKDDAHTHLWALTLEQKRISNLLNAKHVLFVEINKMDIKEKSLYINQFDQPDDINQFYFDHNVIECNYYIAETIIWDSFNDFKSASLIKK